MKKSLFIISSILGNISLLAIYVCVLLEKTFPILGRMATHFSADRRYDIQYYTLELNTVILCCFLFFLLNLVLAVWAYISENQKSKGVHQ